MTRIEGSRQIGPRTVGPRTVGPRTIGPRVPTVHFSGWTIDVSWSFSVRPSGAGLGTLHFVIYIFVLDICGQHLGDICQLKVFCAPFGRRVGECTFCKVYFL